MTSPSPAEASPSIERTEAARPSLQPEHTWDPQLCQWGGRAALAGVVLMLGAFFVVGALGLPDASDSETLTDFADIEAGRIAEHFLYLGAIMMFALHLTVLHRLLAPSHGAAALFGTTVAGFGFVVMAASSLLHVSTSPLADLYTAPNTSSQDLRSIEHAWHGAQSVFDTMLATGALLVPIGILLLAVAMRGTRAFGSRLTALTVGLGTAGVLGAVIAVVDPGSMLLAVSVLAIVLFHLTTGWRTLRLGDERTVDLTASDLG